MVLEPAQPFGSITHFKNLVILGIGHVGMDRVAFDPFRIEITVKFLGLREQAVGSRIDLTAENTENCDKTTLYIEVKNVFGIHSFKPMD